MLQNHTGNWYIIMSVCLSVHPSVYLSVYLSIHQSVRLSVHLPHAVSVVTALAGTGSTGQRRNEASPTNQR